ncbi:hypothetical protein [Streptomyces stelliscabiei]|uniref:hypothetical protein n=1 Tax=Streptomyces stelliscabiei TaxID=146820 RepID=UPI002FF2D4E5
MNDSPLKDRHGRGDRRGTRHRSGTGERARREARGWPSTTSTKPALRATAAALPRRGAAIRADVSDDAALDDAAEAVRSRLGRPRSWWRTRGIAEGGPFARSDPDTWRRVDRRQPDRQRHQTARAFPAGP